MRYILIFWAAPIGFLVAWYGLSYHDINFGTLFFSRAMHDAVFQVYADILGIAPETIPPLLVKALVVDTLFIMAVFAFRRRKKIRAWWEERRTKTHTEEAVTGDVSANPVVYPAE